jgi:cell division protein FtsQ
MSRVKKRPAARLKSDIARPSRIKLLMRRQRRNLRFVLFGLTGFAVVLAGAALSHSARKGGMVATLQERIGRAIDLRVQTIEVHGQSNTPEPLLRAALGVSKGDPILGFSVEGARQRIETLSCVEHVAVERRLPGTIYVDITERRPYAIWQNQGKFQLIDRTGEVVTNEDVATFADLPLVVGIGAPAHAADMLTALAAVPDIKSRVAALVRVGGRRWNLQLKNNITVMLPEAHEAAALDRLRDLQNQQQLLDRPLVFVDMRLPDRLAVRALPAAAAAPQAAPETKTPENTRDSANRRAT